MKLFRTRVRFSPPPLIALSINFDEAFNLKSTTMKNAEQFLKDNALSNELLNWDDKNLDPVYMSEIMETFLNQNRREIYTLEKSYNKGYFSGITDTIICFFILFGLIALANHLWF